MDSIKYGKLITPDIKLHRQYFKEMVSLIGIIVLFKSPKSDKEYNQYAEIDSSYNEPQEVGCIFDEHPTQYTLKKLGWVSELQENKSLIHVPYDLEGLERGALFIIPSGIDNATGRLFRVDRLSSIMIYPASITCELVPEYENEFDKSLFVHKTNDFNLLNKEDK